MDRRSPHAAQATTAQPVRTQRPSGSTARQTETTERPAERDRSETGGFTPLQRAGFESIRRKHAKRTPRAE